MEYTIVEVVDGVAKIRYSDGSESYIQCWANMTELDMDHLAYANSPMHLRRGSAPEFVSEGNVRVAAEKEYRESLEVDSVPEWLDNRLNEYGNLKDQVAHITENGLESWQAKVAEIKAKYPKPSE